MSSIPVSVEEELTIDSIHGLKSFLVYVDDAYQAFMYVAQESESPLTASKVSQVEAIYAEINSLVTRYIKILDWGGEMSIDQAELLQQFYNQILDAYDSVLQPHVTSPRAALIDQVQTATFLLERGIRLLEDFSELQTTPLNSPAIHAGKISYAQLQQNCTDAKLIFDAIEASVETTTLEDATLIATEQAQGLVDIEATFDELEHSLTALFASGALEQIPKQTVVISNNSNATHNGAQPESIFSPFIKRTMTLPRYASVIKESFSSPSAFEAALRREVYRVEAPSKLDALLGVKYGSAFNFLKNMTIFEIDEFDRTHHRQDIRAALAEHTIPYEMYMNWIEAIPYMESLVAETNEMTFGELFVCSEVELLIDTV